MGGGGCGKRCFKSPGCFDIGGRMSGLFNPSSSTGREISEYSSYNAETAQLAETLRVNSSLTEFRIKIEKISDKLERDVLEAAREYLDDFVDYLKKINRNKYAGQILNINLERIQKENRKTEDLVHGFTKKYIQKKISLDDEECLSILKMESGNEKERKMTNYCNTVLKQALKDLNIELRSVLKIQAEMISEQINERVELYNTISVEKVEKAGNIIELKGKDEEQLEREVGKVAYKLTLCDIGNSNLAEVGKI